VGHAAQNVLLQATALDLGAVPVGAFNDRGRENSESLRRGSTLHNCNWKGW